MIDENAELLNEQEQHTEETQPTEAESLLADLKFLETIINQYLWTAILAQGVEKEKIYGDFKDLHQENLRRSLEIIEKIKQTL